MLHVFEKLTPAIVCEIKVISKKFMTDRITRIAWYLYDFGNSSYSAVIAATLFPVYYANEIVGNENNLGDALWGKAISISMALCAVLSPYLGGIADHLRIRKKMLLFFTLLCVLSVSSFSFLKNGMAKEGFVLIVFANFAMETAFVFYNSFLPEVQKETGAGRTSALGFASGYLGSIVSLLFSLFLTKKNLIRFVWPMSALFFLVFSLPLFVYLSPENRLKAGIVFSAKKGSARTLKLLSTAFRDPDLKHFLLAYLFYEDGINTVIVFSSIYAAKTFGFNASQIVWLYLAIQASAMIGAYAISRWIEIWGYKKTLSVSLLAWVIITFLAAFIFQKWHFALISVTGGVFLGVVQASSRALFATFIPPGDESKYFGLYSLVGKSSAIMGPMVFGLVSYVTKNQRIAVIFVSLLFLLGLVTLRRVKERGIYLNSN